MMDYQHNEAGSCCEQDRPQAKAIASKFCSSSPSSVKNFVGDADAGMERHGTLEVVQANAKFATAGRDA